MVRHEHQDGRRRVGRELREGAHELLAPRQVEARGGLVQQQDLRVRHECAGDLDALALPLGQGAVVAVREVRDVEGREQVLGALLVELLVRLLPAPRHAVRGGQHDVPHGLVPRDPVREGGRGEADPRAQLEDVDPAQALAQELGRAGRGVRACGEDLQHGRLAGTVGAEDDPALALVHLPVHGVEDGGGTASNGDALQVENRAHEARPYPRRAGRTAGSGTAAAPPGRLP